MDKHARSCVAPQVQLVLVMVVGRISLLSIAFALTACTSGIDGDALLGDRKGKLEPEIPAVDQPGQQTPAPVQTPAKPIGEVGKWSWRDTPGSSCANGEQTGIGINPGTSKEVVIFLMGGGACWDEVTCSGLDIANNLDGYTKATFEGEMAPGGKLDELFNGSLFDRTVETNPYREATHIFVPYCTGDVFSGDAEQQFFFPFHTHHFSGRKNIEAMLKTVVPAVPGTSRVTFTGSSAGGFGAAVNYWRVKDAFPNTPVDLVDDSGPPFKEWKMLLMPLWKRAWDLDGALPPDCDECKSDIAAVPIHYATKYPTDKFAYLSYDIDPVISIFFAAPPPLFTIYLHQMNDSIAELPNSRFFAVPGINHTMLGKLSTESKGVTLGSWLTKMHSGSPEWANVHAR